MEIYLNGYLLTALSWKQGWRKNTIIITLGRHHSVENFICTTEQFLVDEITMTSSAPNFFKIETVSSPISPAARPVKGFYFFYLIKCNGNGELNNRIPNNILRLRLCFDLTDIMNRWNVYKFTLPSYFHKNYKLFINYFRRLRINSRGLNIDWQLSVCSTTGKVTRPTCCLYFLQPSKYLNQAWQQVNCDRKAES